MKSGKNREVFSLLRIAIFYAFLVSRILCQDLALAFSQGLRQLYPPVKTEEFCRVLELKEEDPLSGPIKIAEKCLQTLDWPGSHGKKRGGPWEYDVEIKYKDNFKGKRGTFSLNGLSFEGTSKEYQFFLKLVGQDKEDGYFIPEEIFNRIEEGKCSRPISFVCALSSLYGQNDEPADSIMDRREAGMRAMNVAYEFGYFITPRRYIRVRSGVKKERASIPYWSLNSVKQIDTVLRKLPPTFYHMETLKYFYRTMEQDQYLLSWGTNAWMWTGNPPEIVLKQSTFNPFKWSFWGSVAGVHKGDQKDGSCTIAHELAHAFEFNYPERVKKLNLFRNERNRWGFRLSSTRDTNYSGMEKMSDYAFTNRHEYFAVAVDKFICHPEEMLKYAPELFAVIKDGVFEGKDFLPRGHEDANWRDDNRRRRSNDVPFFDLKNLSQSIFVACTGGYPLQARYHRDEETGKEQVYYYKKGYIWHGSRIKSVLIGRTSHHEHFRKCFHKKAISMAQKIIDEFPDCLLPDQKGIMEVILQQLGRYFHEYDEKIIRQGRGNSI